MMAVRSAVFLTAWRRRTGVSAQPARRDAGDQAEAGKLETPSR